MISITSEEDVKLIGITTLYFYASWLPYHPKMLTMIGKIEEKYKDIKFLAIDTDSFKSLSKRMKVTSIPTVIIFKNGVEEKRVTGLILTNAFRRVFADIYELDINKES